MHDQLSQDIWDAEALRPEVQAALMRIAQAFADSIGVSDLKLVDVHFVGSLANYNYTDGSDIDLHLVYELDGTDMVMAREMFNAKKILWNLQHDIYVKGHEVELYAQPTTEKTRSAGVYSVLNSEWINRPEPDFPEIDYDQVQEKAQAIRDAIDKVIGTRSIHTQEHLEKLKVKLRDMRKIALDRGGEYAVENLAFKEVRRSGHLQKLIDATRGAMDRNLSLESTR